MPRCRVSFIDSEGISHAAEVHADSLYEAVALAVAEFRGDEITTAVPAPTTEFVVAVMRKPIEHRISFKKVEDWCRPSTKGGPAQTVKRERFRKLLTGRTA